LKKKSQKTGRCKPHHRLWTVADGRYQFNATPDHTAIPNAYRFNGGVRAQEGSGTSAENHASLLPYIETTHDTGDGVGYETPLAGHYCDI
jgi:hypothetical protein